MMTTTNTTDKFEAGTYVMSTSADRPGRLYVVVEYRDSSAGRYVRVTELEGGSVIAWGHDRNLVEVFAVAY